MQMLTALRSLLARGILTGFFLLVFLSSARAEKNVALIIGNSDYAHVQPLKNPVNDAKALGKLFTELGYDVQLVIDADRDTFTKALGDFSQRSTGADAAVFYYAGHGLSLDGRNYLIPVDSNIERATDVRLGAAVDAEVAIDQALADAKVKLVFLDACRNNPFIEQIKRSLGSTRATSVSSGLSEMKSGEGTLIAFSTAPGQTALDGEGSMSPFAEALLRHLGEPGLEVRLAMTKVRADVEKSTDSQQTPWESTNLTGFYYFNPSTVSSAPQDSNSGNTLTSTSPELDLEYWKSIRDSDDPTLLRSYISKFPQGVYRELAEARLKSTEQSVNPDIASVTATVIQSDSQPTTGPASSSRPAAPKTERRPTEPDVKMKIDKASPASEKQQRKKVEATSQKNKGLADNSSSSADMGRFLSKSILRRGPHSWILPPGAQKVGDSASGLGLTVLFKGRRYRCTAAGSSAGSTRVRCYLA